MRLAKQNFAGVYVRHRLENTLLQKFIDEYWPEIQAELASYGKYLPTYVTKEFDENLKCGRLEYGFLRGGAILATITAFISDEIGAVKHSRRVSIPETVADSNPSNDDVSGFDD